MDGYIGSPLQVRHRLGYGLNSNKTYMAYLIKYLMIIAKVRPKLRNG